MANRVIVTWFSFLVFFSFSFLTAVDRKGKKKVKRKDVVGNLNLQTSLNERGSINN